jgi:hypothetical protein
MAKKTTPEERRAYIEQQRADREKYGQGPNKRIFGDMSFIDRAGNIVRPTRENPFPTTSGGSKKPYDRKRHYDSTRNYETREEGTPRYHNSSQDISGIMGIIGILAGIFFLSPNLTGNTISNLTNSTSNFLGAGLLVVGLVAGLFWMKQKKK